MRTTLIAASALSLLAACAGYAPPKDLHAGSSEAEVVQAMGQPTGRYPLAEGGQRLEFARGPYGRHTYMIDLDAQGRVVQWDQVLDPRYFDVLGPGMKRDYILRSIGRPSERMGMYRDGQIWSWRYPNNDCLWWQAQFDSQGVVTSAGYASAPGCDGDVKMGMSR
jgi:hypothetical protein